MIVSKQFVPAERFILRPLSAVCAIGAGAYLFSAAWSTGTLLLVMSLFIGAIGQGLPHNQRKTFRQLTQGSAADLTQFEDDLDMSLVDTIKMGRVAMFTGLWAGLAAGVVAGHHGLPWYFSVSIGFVFYIVVTVLVGLSVARACSVCNPPR